ncbi:MAG: hypothetical protein RIC85_04985 [Gammaproteobacteria bacterium]|uniref:hypothetical protein n=1 Tax=Roseovarius sp. TaxID=1486281 RepID=UPI002605F2FF|nr:hypothetical protein [uncultured Roseovarius sp.]
MSEDCLRAALLLFSSRWLEASNSRIEPRPEKLYPSRLQLQQRIGCHFQRHRSKKSGRCQGINHALTSFANTAIDSEDDTEAVPELGGCFASLSRSVFLSY